MIKCNVDRPKNKTAVKCGGSIIDVCVEGIFILGQLYQGIKAQNEEAAEQFRNSMLAALLDPNSTVYQEDRIKNE